MRTKTLLIGIDGVLLDVLLDVDAPNLHRLIADGRLWRSRLYPTLGSRDTLAGTRVESGPGWASILTGVWPDRHGIRDNTFRGARLDVFPSFLDRIAAAGATQRAASCAAQRAASGAAQGAASGADGIRTAAFASWDPLATASAGGPVVTDAVDVRFGLRAEAGLGSVLGDAQVTTAATAHLRDGDPDVVFVYLGGVDEAGHAFRADGVEYRAAIALVDGHVGALLDAVAERPADESWAVIVTTDHGRLPDGSHGEPSDAERASFVVVAGDADVPESVSAFRVVDIAPTILARHGVVTASGAADDAFDGIAVPLG